MGENGEFIGYGGEERRGLGLEGGEGATNGEEVRRECEVELVGADSVFCLGKGVSEGRITRVRRGVKGEWTLEDVHCCDGGGNAM